MLKYLFIFSSLCIYGDMVHAAQIDYEGRW